MIMSVIGPRETHDYCNYNLYVRGINTSKRRRKKKKKKKKENLVCSIRVVRLVQLGHIGVLPGSFGLRTVLIARGNPHKSTFMIRTFLVGWGAYIPSQLSEEQNSS